MYLLTVGEKSIWVNSYVIVLIHFKINHMNATIILSTCI